MVLLLGDVGCSIVVPLQQAQESARSRPSDVGLRSVRQSFWHFCQVRREQDEIKMIAGQVLV